MLFRGHLAGILHGALGLSALLWWLSAHELHRLPTHAS
jgi:hypothetical protein